VWWSAASRAGRSAASSSAWFCRRRSSSGYCRECAAGRPRCKPTCSRRCVAHDIHATVDGDDLAVDVFDLIAHQESSHIGEFAVAADPARRIAAVVAVVVSFLQARGLKSFVWEMKFPAALLTNPSSGPVLQIRSIISSTADATRISTVGIDPAAGMLGHDLLGRLLEHTATAPVFP
jgi:hypothetical protein